MSDHQNAPTHPTDPLDNLKEKLAAIEHERWADWQKWLHSKCTLIEDDEADVQGLMIPAGYVEHLERQIKTDYKDLSDTEKASDMEQVDRYWPLIAAYTTNKIIEYALFICDNLDSLSDKNWLKEQIIELKALNRRKDKHD